MNFIIDNKQSCCAFIYLITILTKMDNKTNNKQELDIEILHSSPSTSSAPASSSLTTTTNPVVLPAQQRKKRIRTQPASKTKVVSIMDYLYPVVFKNKSGELYKIHVNIIERSDVIKASIENNILNLPEYYDEPELTRRTAALLNIIVMHKKLPKLYCASDIKLCQILHSRNIKLSERQCMWFASSSMFIARDSMKMEAFDISCVTKNDQIFPYVVEHIINSCKIPCGKWSYYDLLKNLNNQAVFDAVLRKIFTIAKH